ncbi:MAG: hypothetical protein A2725_00850 [Candidatus Magasanikbacteria bacterium RIFCSPHIGHO2_01_FULL_33_34]|uniref:Gcp-like domain-containing protein n=1 Tax=Candidatus Magasanikbacteria bacterium RIFCSPHIGHO2_01_FULL_33_34 TaxID=1798671 RepID=A0A1F6LIZ4_9BACT|nr:MAG: hypothetical protein A2725_00850 [Candidatus Magasanikbacteria bacterium RIFCSPHIGHO2_01_FULL_33_34]OGH65305.1 MAG: hypothetical protein A3B83_04510 [Candidatus Magasanikbacteria bacterium RIFCSPHIGHO2_02_FULL_33_17]OGH76082.1 MAG: hypothetical protein A3A89_01435 [Candidatus Magasanikbacteria bacterium RIFCSPLOWO2_01_FULL_33_34]OGH81747.1 MAG: hypothetical protein A3F93_00725 [Candidatus Magasanikbacteria bacterium RIFCSPLOWO2_12_FULL_34_7]
MYILINLSEYDIIQLALFDKDSLVETKYNGRNRELLESMDTFLVDNKCDKNKLKGIMVVVGEGSFTNTRISAVVANTFGYALQIPIMSINKNQIDNVQELISEIDKIPVGQYVSAKYSSEPNIG